jgi:hypothetical protein
VTFAAQQRLALEFGTEGGVTQVEFKEQMTQFFTQMDEQDRCVAVAGTEVERRERRAAAHRPQPLRPSPGSRCGRVNVSPTEVPRGGAAASFWLSGFGGVFRSEFARQVEAAWEQASVEDRAQIDKVRCSLLRGVRGRSRGVI